MLGAAERFGSGDGVDPKWRSTADWMSRSERLRRSSNSSSEGPDKIHLSDASLSSMF